ncbi:MAG: DUF4330 family protein [Acetivibrionales bacterium]|jgi:hypothetical protein
MIIKNGKLFGKISIIDIIIVIVLLAVLLFAAARLGIFSPKQAVTVNTEKIRITFYQEEVSTFTVENIKIGDPASDSLKNANLGNVVDIKSDKSVSWGVDKDGKQVKSTKAGYSSVFITTEANALLDSNGIITGGSRFYIGQALNVRFGTSVIWCRIYDAVKVEED